MKVKAISLLTILALVLLLSACTSPEQNTAQTDTTGGTSQIKQEGETDQTDYTTYDVDGETIASGYPSELLSDVEIESLLSMREEEKLAHDVYLSLYEIWGKPVFSNIADSEQTHTEAVKYLLDRYEISDPVQTDEIGVFSDSEFTDLYDQLVQAGSANINSAYTVGATIEDLDIYDLNEWLGSVDNQDIRSVYENLIKGSENHMQAFVSQLEKAGSSYEAQYITPEELDLILN